MDTEGMFTIGFFTFLLPVGWMFAAGYYKRWNRRMDHGDQLPPGLQEDVEQLRRRVLELEERVDFTERLLTTAREADRLPGER